MKFNNVDLAGFFTIQAVRGRGVIKNTVESITVPNRDGAFYRRRTRPPRTLEVDVIIDAASEAELRAKIDELNGILAVDQEAAIIFEDEPGITYYGIPENAGEGDPGIAHQQATLVFICHNPDKYGTAQTTASGSITYAGTATSPPIVTATFSGPASSADLVCGVNTLRIHYDFIAGTKLTVDSEHRKVFINDQLNMPTIDLTLADFPYLQPGANELTITPAATLEITYRERWL